MAITSSFKYTNTSDSTSTSAKVTKKALGLLTNYALAEDTANTSVLNNKTAPIDAQELITYWSRNIDKINTNLVLSNPSKVKKGIQYSVQSEATLVTEDSDDPQFRIDEPVVVTLSVRHPKSGNISNAIVAAQVIRTISACMREDGTWRFDDFMRSAERPVVE